MRVLYLVLIACVCLASAKYLPYEREERDLYRHHQRQIRDLSDASTSNSVDEDSSDSDSTEKTLQEQLEQEKIKQECKQEQKRLKEERKRQEKIEKEERKHLERLEKERRKQEEKERKHQERLQKEERKREEKIKKELQKLDNENNDESDETEDSQDLEDIWENFIYEKYGLTDANSDLAKDAAVHTYLHEKYGLSPQSSDSEFRQAIVKSINESIRTNSTQEDEFKSYLVKEVNVTGIQALIKDNEREIAELKNESALLDNISLPWVAVAKQEIEEKNALLESVSKFLTHLLPNQTTSSDQKTLNSPSESEASLTKQSLGNNNSNLGSQSSGNEDSSVSGTTSTGTEVPMSVNLLSDTTINYEAKISEPTLATASETEGSGDSSTSAGTPNAVEEAELNNLAISSASAPDSNLHVNSETETSGSTLVLASRIQGSGDSSTIAVTPNNAEEAGLNTLLISYVSATDSNSNVNSKTETSVTTLAPTSGIENSGSTLSGIVNNVNSTSATENTPITEVLTSESRDNFNVVTSEVSLVSSIGSTHSETPSSSPTSVVATSISSRGVNQIDITQAADEVVSIAISDSSSVAISRNSTASPAQSVVTSSENVITSTDEPLTSSGNDDANNVATTAVLIEENVALPATKAAISGNPASIPANNEAPLDRVNILLENVTSPADTTVFSAVVNNAATPEDNTATTDGNVATTANSEVGLTLSDDLTTNSAFTSNNVAATKEGIPVDNSVAVTSPADNTVLSAVVNNAATPEDNTATTDGNVATTANSEVGITLSDELTTNSPVTSNNAAATTEGIPVDNSVAVSDTVIDATVVPNSVQELSILTDFSATVAPSEIISTLSTNAEPLPSSPTSLDVSVPSQTSVVDNNLGIQSSVANTDAPVTTLVTDNTATIAPVVTDLLLVNTIVPIAPELLVVVTDVPVVDAQPQAVLTVQESQSTVGPSEVIPPITVPSEPGAAIVDMALQ